MLGEHLVEHGPDELGVGVVGAAGKGDLRAFGQEQLGIGPAAGGDEVAAVDHGGGHVPVIDEASGAGTPGRAGLGFIAFGGEVANVFEGFAALDEGLALGDQAFEFDRADFRAVLFLLAFPLPVFVAVELTLRAGGLFVEEVGQAPEQLVEVGLEARVAERAAKDVEQVRDGAGDKIRVGKRAGIGLGAGRLIAVEFEVVDHASGRGTAMGGFEVVCRRHGFFSFGSGGRPLRP